MKLQRAGRVYNCFVVPWQKRKVIHGWRTTLRRPIDVSGSGKRHKRRASMTNYSVVSAALLLCLTSCSSVCE